MAAKIWVYGEIAAVFGTKGDPEIMTVSPAPHMPDCEAVVQPDPLRENDHKRT